ncbi:DNA recombination protein RmuC [Actinocorallia populi]|uniref:DNA recombination protein RmuC n=1 Tax=Actinocorallia populi TaxID=2079200 RepID=UPI0018E5385F|nr:DNA recombination protein RmuC [Actinocorallia populi]
MRRDAERTAAQKVAEEQSREARRQAEELRAERDHAARRSEELEKANSALTTEQQGLRERLGRLDTELVSVRADLQRGEAEAERLHAALADGTRRSEETERQLRAAEQQISAAQAREARLHEESQELKRVIAEESVEKQALTERAVALEAKYRELDQVREENNRLQEETLRAMVTEMLKLSQEQLVATAGTTLAEASRPVHEQLAAMERRLREFDTARTESEARLSQEIIGLTAESVRNRQETTSLVQALKQPQVRGSWGEMQLRRAAEAAGMLEHCTFDLQVYTPGDGQDQRPDMVVKLAGGKHVVVDAKVSMDAFLSATQATEEAEVADHWQRHAKQVRKHVDALAAKEYFRRFASPDFVVMYLPSDAFLVPALEHSPTLLEDAIARRVLIVTPTSFIALLRTVAYAWTQAALADNLKQVFDLGRELHERLSILGGHVDKLGRSLDRSVRDYNAVIGSLEGRVMVSARKFNELKVVEEQLKPLQTVLRTPRRLSSPELVQAAADAVDLLVEESEIRMADS